MHESNHYRSFLFRQQHLTYPSKPDCTIKAQETNSILRSGKIREPNTNTTDDAAAISLPRATKSNSAQLPTLNLLGFSLYIIHITYRKTLSPLRVPPSCQKTTTKRRARVARRNFREFRRRGFGARKTCREMSRDEDRNTCVSTTCRCDAVCYVTRVNIVEWRRLW